jgi:hypothetical protein
MQDEFAAIDQAAVDRNPAAQAHRRAAPEAPRLSATSAKWLSLLAVSLVLLAACGGGSSTPPVPPTLTLSTNPDALTGYPNTSFSVTVTATTTGTAATPTVNLGPLPTGLTTSTAFPLAVPSVGATISFAADATLTPGSYSITLNGQADAATATKTLVLNVPSGAPPGFSFVSSQGIELVVPIGGSGQFQFETALNGTAQLRYSISLSATGLPPDTTASFTPPTISVGQKATLTIAATTNAPISRNTQVVVTGAPACAAPPSEFGILADVTPAPGNIPDSRTDYLSTEGTPFSATYDAAHNLIFASNPSWNRVDVISNATHLIVNGIPVRDPRGVDLSIDGTKVWVATGSQQMFAINTSTLQATRYLLPQLPQGSATTPWEGMRVFALSDGNLLLLGNTALYIAVWDPVSNTLTPLNAPGGVQADYGYMARSGDGRRVYGISADSDGQAFYYDVASKSLSQPVSVGEYGGTVAVNQDGSRVVLGTSTTGLNVYDGQLNLIGPVPGGPLGGMLLGGLLFGPDNTKLYEVSIYPTVAGTPAIYIIDASSLQVLATAPAIPMIPVMQVLSFGYYISTPFAVDNTGMLLGIQDYGIAFDDSTYVENFSPYQGGTPTLMQHMTPYSGPLKGGTVSSGFGNAFDMTPDVWYGAVRGSASTDSASITSPPASVPGPVDLKWIFPDGIEVFQPLFFDYSPYPQYAFISGASPNGGAPARVAGFGLPSDASGGTLTVGGNQATITTQTSQYLHFTGTPFPSTFLDYTIPPGLPGYADLAVTTPDGTGTLPKAIYYAQSVTSYSSPDSFSAVLYDAQRQQVYLSAGNHIDVFSLTSKQYLAPLTPPAHGANSEFAGLALTPDNSSLLATNLLDGSLAVIALDNPSDSFFISVAPPNTSNANCTVGPLYVGSSLGGQAFVVYGGIPGAACGPGGPVYQVDLTAKTSSKIQYSAACQDLYNIGASYVRSTHDGTLTVLGASPWLGGSECLYNANTQIFTGGVFYQPYGAAIANDGNVAATQWVLIDSSNNVIGRLARPDVFYPATTWAPGFESFSNGALSMPTLNDAGSLYYWAYPNGFEIIDVQHGSLRLRFSLVESVQMSALPIAIDTGGRNVFLVTDRGLTIVDLGSAPLSIGHLSSSVASVGAQVQVRGSGFSATTTVSIGGQSASATFTDEDTLSVTVPNVSLGPQNIVLKNADGTTYTLENGITVQ